MNETPDFLVKALQALVPKAQFISYGGKLELLDWKDERPKPNDKEINDKIAELQTEYDKQAYVRSRLQEYPDLHECIHAILDDDLTALQAKRKLVKDKFPKP
jgi:hypothetical protein